MDYQDRVELHRYGYKHVSEYTLETWAINFLEEIQNAESECETERLQLPPQLDHAQVVAAMRKASRRLIILGFSGTLLPRTVNILQGGHPGTKLSQVLLGNLQVIAEDV